LGSNRIVDYVYRTCDINQVKICLLKNILYICNQLKPKQAMETYKLSNGRTLRMVQDDSVDSPRDWDNLSRMIFFGKYGYLGDKHSFDFDCEFDSRDEFIEKGSEIVKKEFNCVIVKPVHCYLHSGLGISTSYEYPYNCRWDSGTIGFAIVTKEDIRKEYNVKRIGQKHIDLADKVLEGEVKTLNQYVSGEVYGFVIEDSDGTVEDSCYGFYGSDIKTNGILGYLSVEDNETILNES
jgi:hypothetical protein